MRSEAWFLMALADGVALCSNQLYEHWRAMVDIFRETLSGVLRRVDAEGMLPVDPADEQSPADPISTAIVLYALLLGVQQGLIDPERYLPLLQKRAEALEAAGCRNAAAMLMVKGGAL